MATPRPTLLRQTVTPIVLLLWHAHTSVDILSWRVRFECLSRALVLQHEARGRHCRVCVRVTNFGHNPHSSPQHPTARTYQRSGLRPMHALRVRRGT